MGRVHHHHESISAAQSGRARGEWASVCLCVSHAWVVACVWLRARACWIREGCVRGTGGAGGWEFAVWLFVRTIARGRLVWCVLGVPRWLPPASSIAALAALALSCSALHGSASACMHACERGSGGRFLVMGCAGCPMRRRTWRCSFATAASSLSARAARAASTPEYRGGARFRTQYLRVPESTREYPETTPEYPGLSSPCTPP